MGYKIRHNRFISLLQRQDQELYLSAVAFSMLAENKWLIEKHRHPVSHGYQHISNIIITLEEIFKYYSDDEILNKLGDKNIFILLSSIYVHDLGMQYYYEDIFLDLKNVNNDNLTDSDYKRLRDRHTDIIYNKIVNLKPNTIQNFFEEEYQTLKAIAVVNNHTITQMLAPVLNYKMHIALVSSHHSKTFDELTDKIAELKKSKSLICNHADEDALGLITALLQFADALDMSKSRINERSFISKLENISSESISSDDSKDLDRMFNCYIIDKIESIPLYEENTIKSLTFRLNMSLSQLNLQDHADEVHKKRKAYARRLKRTWDDCISVIDKALALQLVVDSNSDITFNNEKILPNDFFNLNIIDDLSISLLIGNKIESLADTCTYSYIKLYSGITDTYFGGFARNLESTDKHRVESLSFIEDEWNLKKYIDKGCGLTNKSFLPPKNRLEEYRVIANMARKKDIKSGFYFVIKFEQQVVGFIRANYDYKITDELLEEKKDNYTKIMKNLGEKIINLHKVVYVDKFEHILTTTSFFEGYEEEVKVLINLYKNLYKLNENSNANSFVLDKVTIKEFKNLIGDTQIPAIKEDSDRDKKFEVILNKELFILIFDIFEKRYNSVTNKSIIKSIDNNKDECYVRYMVAIELENIKLDYVGSLVEYLNHTDLMDINFDKNRVQAEYAFIFKAFFTIFSSSVRAKYDKDINSLILNIFVPKRRIEKITIEEQVKHQMKYVNMRI